MRKFARWFVGANHEPLVMGRVTTRDVTDFKNALRRDQGQAVATVNRAIVTLRRFFGWLVDQGQVRTNPVKAVKELKRQQLAPKGMERQDVRRLLREVAYIKKPLHPAMIDLCHALGREVPWILRW